MKQFFCHIVCTHNIWALTRKNLSSGFGNNKDAVQPVHPCSLISTFAIRLLESIVSKLAIREIAFFYLVSVAEQAGLNLTVGNLKVFLI